MKKTISILGSTGSIGLSALKIIDKKRKMFKINLLSANKNFQLISNQIKKYKPKIFIINDQKVFKKTLKKFKNRNGLKILSGFDFLNLKKKSDITISAIPGIAGLRPTIEMISFSKKILIANKEAIICGWNLIKRKSEKYKTSLIPIDSEHYSILRLLENHNLKQIKKVYITASGGPFLKLKLSKFKNIKPKDALKHPKWKMGKKVSIDSATLMNKILELIEAQKLFKLKNNQLDILIHPESLVHAIVQFNNGITKFIYHDTSMIIPLANAMIHGNFNINEFLKIKRSKNKYIENLTFEKVNKNIFPIIKLKKRINEYPSTSIIINASNEILVDQFLSKNLPFLAINKIILAILKDRNYKNYAIRKPNNLKQINIVDKWARNTTLKKIKSYAF